eukprot:GEMP01042825.1.p1 GENE.GEMP01042825.1~~GEMP01042825.1.p1  ORF type:complete len:105 (-),score=1.43 GEMP01042825.1:1247-1561(-)
MIGNTNTSRTHENTNTSQFMWTPRRRNIHKYVRSFTGWEGNSNTSQKSADAATHKNTKYKYARSFTTGKTKRSQRNTLKLVYNIFLRLLKRFKNTRHAVTHDYI